VKKIFSILFALLILFSGMHFSIAIHYCGGAIAATKISFSHALATCGMEEFSSINHTQAAWDFSCCKNKIADYSIDNNYTPSSLQIKEVAKHVLHVLFVPVAYAHQFLNTSNYIFSGESPPHTILASAVRLDNICVFRI
jgi:hypothetical protein